MERTEHSFYAVWHDGMEWPELFAKRELAEDRVKLLAREHMGTTVHLLSMEPVGSALYPNDGLRTTGCITA